MKLGIIINSIETFVSNQTRAFSPSFKTDANYSVYRFKVESVKSVKDVTVVM